MNVINGAYTPERLFIGVRTSYLSDRSAELCVRRFSSLATKSELWRESYDIDSQASRFNTINCDVTNDWLASLPTITRQRLYPFLRNIIPPGPMVANGLKEYITLSGPIGKL